ncbi:MAG: 3'-phosphoesterase, partial [Candidatus Aenigmarchaeota archaeon]|nr:3'-phosphoesterase [Candidatus Aenigmarchaeota archaeon]
SWAIPKELPKGPGIKRLAIPVEDHSLDYANFEGEIPKGFYGGGKVLIWDKGNYEEIEWTKDKIVVNFKGKKLKGEYVLVKMKSGKYKDYWLFFKKK